MKRGAVMENSLVRKRNGELEIIPSVKGAKAGTIAGLYVGGKIGGTVGAFWGGAIGGTFGLIFGPED